MSRRLRAATSRRASAHHTEHEAVSTDSEDADLERVAKGLKRSGLGVRDVRRDGNCFFRAVSDQMYGTEEYHAYLRDLCCDYMDKHEEDLAPFLDDSESDYGAYVENMREDGVWAGNIEIHATSMATHRDVRIHQHKKPSYDLVNNYTDAPLHLFYHYGEHYASVRPLSQLNDSSPAAHAPLRQKPSGSSSTSEENDPRETWAVLEDASTELLQKVEHSEAAARYFRRIEAHDWAERLDEEATLASDTLTHVYERVDRWKVAHAEKRELSSDEDDSEDSSITDDSYGSNRNASREKKYLTRTLAKADERISDILESAARVRDSQQGERRKTRSKKRDQEERRKARKARRRREQEAQAGHRSGAGSPPLSIGMWSVS